MEVPGLVKSGKRLHNYGKSQFLMGKLTNSMAIVNSYVSLPEGKLWIFQQAMLDWGQLRNGTCNQQ